MFDSLGKEILEDCIRVRKSESFDSEIIQENDVYDHEETEQKAEKLTMSCIKSKSPAQFYRSFTSEPEEEDTPGLDFDDLEVKMENSFSGADVLDEIIDEFCDSDSSSIMKQPIVQVKMDVIKEVLADQIQEESSIITDAFSLQKETQDHILVEVEADTPDCDPSSKTEEPLPPSDNVNVKV